MFRSLGEVEGALAQVSRTSGTMMWQWGEYAKGSRTEGLDEFLTQVEAFCEDPSRIVLPRLAQIEEGLTLRELARNKSGRSNLGTALE